MTIRYEKEVKCSQCGVLRYGEVSASESERECRSTTTKPCPVCNCPFADIVETIVSEK